ncbi:hypothetical protein DPX39_050029700 [Trypanosoma brucei equiperdum]|uniref:Uncharacterized protein n=1 Tax=Trypanosoma brucei equiperdum TaxID=630700 RepID=A0A3L6L8F2_9TRYP|nr:hypothetical protein DPX39_050029700 [Trypanosoma brucei equiperdum]
MERNTSRYQHPPYRGRASVHYGQTRPTQRAPPPPARGNEPTNLGAAAECYGVMTRYGAVQHGTHASGGPSQLGQQLRREGNSMRFNDIGARFTRSGSNGGSYGGGSGYGSSVSHNPPSLRRQSSGLLSRDNSLCGHLSAEDVGYGTLYRPRSFSRGSRYGMRSSSQQGSLRSHSGAGGGGSFVKRSSFRSSPSRYPCGSFHWTPDGPASASNSGGSFYGTRRRTSGAGVSSVPNPARCVYDMGGAVSRRGSLLAGQSGATPREGACYGINRKNSMRLSRTNSCMNGFYSYGANALASRREMGGYGSLPRSRLAGRPTAPPNWPGVPTNASRNLNPMGTRQPQRPLNEPIVPDDAEKDVPGQLVRCNSEKKIGIYFKDVQPTEEGEYKQGDAASGRKSKASMSSSAVTNIRTIVLLEGEAEDSIHVDGTTMTLLKPNSDEPVRFETKEIVYYDPNDSNIYMDSTEELCDTFLLGCNISLVMADAQCPAQQPTQWHSWNVLRRLMRDVFARMPDRAELRLSISLMDDDKVMDLLVPDPQFVNLTVSYSPLFGNVPHGMTFEVLDSASEFGGLLKVALSRAVGQDSGEFGIILVVAILKQVRKNPSNPKDEEDVILSSLFATGVGDGVVHYSRILDKNPAEPRAMFQFAVGGPSQTAAVVSMADDPKNLVKNHQFMTTLQRLGKIENYTLRLGSVRRFVSYTKESLPKTRIHLQNLPEGPEKEALKRSVTRYEKMLADAEAMLESPDCAAPKTYVR